MKTQKFRAELLNGLMKIRKVCTLDEMIAALGTSVRKTIFRKLAELEYQTSYSHHGKYYALKSTCQFNESGLWAYREAWFSAAGHSIGDVQRICGEIKMRLFRRGNEHCVACQREAGLVDSGKQGACGTTEVCGRLCLFFNAGRTSQATG